MSAIPVTPQNVFSRVAHRTGLLGDTLAKRKSIAAVVTATCGVRGDKLDGIHLSLAARFPGYTQQTLLRALQERKSLIRTWGVRGTLQVVPRPQVSTYLAAAGITAPRWMRFLDARSKLSTTARLRLLKRLCPEVLSRESLRSSISDANTRLFMLREAAQEGYIVWKDGDGPQSNFVWTKDWLGQKIERLHDYNELVGWYLESYGPVGAPDLAGFLGVTVAAARKLIAKHRVSEVIVEGEEFSTFLKDTDLEELRGMRKSQSKGMVIVPPADPLLLAYKTRYRPNEEAGDDQGLVFLDSRLVAWWTLVREDAAVHFLEDVDQKAVLAGIRSLLDRAEIQQDINLVPA